MKKPLDIVIKDIEGPYKEIDRKLWNVLMYSAVNELDEYSLKGEFHSVDEYSIIKLFSDHSGLKDSKRIWESLTRLAYTKILLTVQEGKETRNYVGVSLIEALEVENEGSLEKKMYYKFPKPIAELAQSPEIFSRIRMHFMLSLRGKYSVALYELLESRINMEKAKYHEWDIERFRMLIRVPEGKLTRWVDLKRNAIEPFIKEINSNPDKSGFIVDYETVTGSRKKVIKIRFTIKKHSSRKNFEKRLVKEKSANQERQFPTFTTDVMESIERCVPGLDIRILLANWKKDVAPKIDSILNPGAHFRVYCENQFKKAPPAPCRSGGVNSMRDIMKGLDLEKV